MKVLLPALAALLLMSCGSSKQSVEPIMRPESRIQLDAPVLDPSVRTCGDLSMIPFEKAENGVLGLDVLLPLWAHDRAIGANCKRNLGIVVRHNDRLAAALRG